LPGSSPHPFPTLAGEGKGLPTAAARRSEESPSERIFISTHRKEPNMKTSTRKDLYAQVTNSIITLMEKG
jgi:hypothetical protein